MSEEDLSFLEKITKLEVLNLDGCKQLEELAHHITNQEYLRELYLSGTSLKELPDNIGQLDRLRKMKIRIVLSKSLPSSLGDLSSLMELSVVRCPKLERLPDSLGGLSSLTKLSIAFCFELERPPDSLGALSSLTNLRIEECYKLECLPDSLGDLSSLTSLYIRGCHTLESLPDSLGNLSSLTHLEIISCFRLETLPKSVRQLRNLQRLSINSCPIREVDFGAAPLISPGLSNLKWIRLKATAVWRISIFNNCCPSLEELHVYENHLNVFQNQHLEEIEAWPTTLKYIYLKNCEMLKYIPSFAKLTSLRKLVLKGCYEIEKIQGIENCTRLKELSVNTCWEMPGIESFQHMQNLKRLELKANHGSVIARCIQTIQKWPADLRICSRVLVPDAASVVDSLLSLNVVPIDFISKQKIESWPKLVQRRSSNGDAFMVCIVIDCFSPNLSVRASRQSNLDRIEFEEGRWIWVRIFTQRSQYFIEEEFSIGGFDARRPVKGAVEKGLVLRGEEQVIMEALRSLLPLFQDFQEM